MDVACGNCTSACGPIFRNVTNPELKTMLDEAVSESVVNVYWVTMVGAALCAVAACFSEHIPLAGAADAQEKKGDDGEEGTEGKEGAENTAP